MQPNNNRQRQLHFLSLLDDFDAPDMDDDEPDDEAAEYLFDRSAEEAARQEQQERADRAAEAEKADRQRAGEKWLGEVAEQRQQAPALAKAPEWPGRKEAEEKRQREEAERRRQEEEQRQREEAERRRQEEEKRQREEAERDREKQIEESRQWVAASFKRVNQRKPLLAEAEGWSVSDGGLADLLKQAKEELNKCAKTLKSGPLSAEDRQPALALLGQADKLAAGVEANVAKFVESVKKRHLSQKSTIDAWAHLCTMALKFSVSCDGFDQIVKKTEDQWTQAGVKSQFGSPKEFLKLLDEIDLMLQANRKGAENLEKKVALQEAKSQPHELDDTELLQLLKDLPPKDDDTAESYFERNDVQSHMGKNWRSTMAAKTVSARIKKQKQEFGKQAGEYKRAGLTAAAQAWVTGKAAGNVQGSSVSKALGKVEGGTASPIGKFFDGQEVYHASSGAGPGSAGACTVWFIYVEIDGDSQAGVQIIGVGHHIEMKKAIRYQVDWQIPGGPLKNIEGL